MILTENMEGGPADSTLSSKRPLDSDEGEKPLKRCKVEQAEHSSGSRELAPRPAHLQTKPATPRTAPPKKLSSSSNKRATSINLKNYPSNHHPVGIAIWILQKVEQARRELEAHRTANHNGSNSSPQSTFNSPVGPTGSIQWQISPLSSYVNIQPAQEQEAERLQAQRNRKTKQRQDNWAKSSDKETDVVARAKIEAKKHFESFPFATDADQQVWIEEKVRLDFGRLLDRLAAQMNSEIVGIAPFQIGFADYYFNRATNPQLASLDQETINAARIIADVLPALTESVVSERHQYAAEVLVHALVKNAPPQEAFFAAIALLAQDYQVLWGLDKLIGTLFIPKTGPQLARKRTGNDSDQSGSGGFGASPYSSTPHGAPIWHWKEPATIANSTRYSSPATRAPAPVNGEPVDTAVQPYHQDPLPPPMVVQAEVFRPPPPLSGYYQYQHMQNYSQVNTPNHHSAPLVPPTACSNYSGNHNHENGTFVNPPPLQQFGKQSRSDLVQSHERSPLAPAPEVSNVPNGNDDGTHEHLVPKSTAMISPSVNSRIKTDVEAVEKHSSLTKKTNEATPEPSMSPEQVVSAISPTSAENPRRRSSRGTILTSKARAAGILLGTQINAVEQADSDKISKAPKTSIKSTSPVAIVEQQQASAIKRSEALENTVAEVSTRSVKGSAVKSDGKQACQFGVRAFVPRSSGRERKPTAKIIESSAENTVVKSTDYSSSAPRVSSKLRLSMSSQSSAPSENITTEASVASQTDILSSCSNGQVSAEDARATRDKLGKSQAENAKNKYWQAVPLNASPDKGRWFSDLKPPSTPAKYSKFLTNDKGQNMSQALLQLAQIAADWSDSDDNDENEDEEDAEFMFQNKLNQALQRHVQQSKSPINADGRGQMSSQSLSSAMLNRIAFSRPGHSRYDDRQSAQGYAPQGHVAPGSWYQQSPGSTSLQPAGDQVPPTQARIDHQPLLLPGMSNPVANDMAHPITGPRSNSQMTDDWLALLKLKDEARSRRLPISDTMGLDQLTNLLQAHDTGELNVASKPGLRILAPTTARPGVFSNTHQQASPNGNTNGHYYGPSSGIPPSQFYPPIQQHALQNSLPPWAGSGSDTPKPAFRKHIQYIAPNVRGSPDQASSTNGLEKSVTTESRVPGPRVPSRSTPQPSSRYDFNPRGLNGGPPGGGSIINGPGLRAAQPRKRPTSRAPADAASVNSSADEMRHSTPSTRDGGSATPQPRAQTPQFKKGGIVLSFGTKATRGAAA